MLLTLTPNWECKIELSIFKLALYVTITSLLFLIFPIEPLFGWDNIFINNSAKILVLGLTIILTILFFQWLNMVALYNAKSTSLLNYITLLKENQLTNPII